MDKGGKLFVFFNKHFWNPKEIYCLTFKCDLTNVIYDHPMKDKERIISENQNLHCLFGLVSTDSQYELVTKSSKSEMMDILARDISRAMKLDESEVRKSIEDIHFEDWGNNKFI